MAGDGLLEPIAVPTGGVSVLGCWKRSRGPFSRTRMWPRPYATTCRCWPWRTLIARLRVRHEDEIHVDAEALRGIR